MKIISWNCNRAFRNKFSIIQKYDADIYVIQECENPKKYPKEFSRFLTNYVWCGENENQGLAVFAKPNVKIEKNDWPVYPPSSFFFSRWLLLFRVFLCFVKL